MSTRILQGDCREVLRTLPDASVHMVVTSPPYFGLRDYGVSGQIGLEQSPAEYVAQMVEVFREVWRVLRDDGTCWVNLGDAYCSGTAAPRKPTTTTGPAVPSSWSNRSQPQRIAAGYGVKVKDLLMMPARVAIALCDDGWYLRSNIIWAKRNCMPESVRDRPTNAHEHIFLVTKRSSYFYDAVAIEEDGEIAAGTRAAKGSEVRSALKNVNGRPPEYYEYTGKRNKRSVWWMATQPYPDAHFATFPPELPEICIKAGTSERGCCSACGAPWARQTERAVSLESGSGRAGRKPTGKGAGGAQTDSGTYDVRMGSVVSTATTGWLPSCSCDASVVACTVLDPFAGAFTTAMVADRLGRDCIGIELNQDYCDMARRRIENDAGMFAQAAAQ